MPYGYLGQNTPNQTVSNSGVFSISDVASLEKQGKLGGSLELIEEQTASTVSVLDFTNLGNYDVHYMTFSNFQADTSTTDYVCGRLSNNGGTSFISTANHQRGFFRINTSGTTADINGTTFTEFNSFFSIDSDYPSSQGYAYFYNLLDSSKYSFVTFHTFNSAGYYIYFGGYVLPVAETHNAIRIFTLTNNMQTGTAKLYGVKQL